MKNMDEIDVTKKILVEEFIFLFASQAELLPHERKKLEDVYYPVYTTFIDRGGVEPTQAWEAAKNLFVSQETQIGQRLNS